MKLKKQSPFLFDDKSLYRCTPKEIDFALNSRKMLDYQCGKRLNRNTSRIPRLEVGFFLHTEEAAISGDETVFRRAFDSLSKSGATELLAIPSGYHYNEKNNETMETTEYFPALIGKIFPLYENYVKIRGSMICLYSGQCLIFDSDLTHAMLDLNGHYSMFMGPRSFVEETLNCSVEDSWEEVRKGTSIQPTLLNNLRDALSVYGY